jgi:hypothetical protein
MMGGIVPVDQSRWMWRHTLGDSADDTTDERRRRFWWGTNIADGTT